MFGNLMRGAGVVSCMMMRANTKSILHGHASVFLMKRLMSPSCFTKPFSTFFPSSPMHKLANPKMSFSEGSSRRSRKFTEYTHDEKSVTLKFSNDKTAKFHHIWLRDHCHCNECYHPVTYQRQIDTYKIPLDIKPKSISNNQDSINIEWFDGHKSSFKMDWLFEHCYGQPYHCYDVKAIKKQLWSAADFKDVPDSYFKEVMEDDMKLYEFLEKLVRYGIVFLDGVEEPYPEALSRLGSRIGHIQRTHYGDLWIFTSGDVEFADTAYLSIKLECHNDGTYFTESPGLQLLHCNSHTGTGGENVFVDGFYVAEQLRMNDPEAFNFLATTKIPSHYYEKDSFVFKAYDTILKLDDFDNQLYQIRFNSDDRDILSCLSFENVEKFYKASHSFTHLIRQESNELVVRPKPGRAALFDNWRVFHARNAFTGKRQMSGYYIQRSTFLSKLLSLREKLSIN